MRAPAACRRRTSRLALVATLVVGTTLGMGLSAPHSFARAKKDRCTPSPDRVDAVAVEWGRSTSVSSCFYFSGPGDLGRDDHLGARAAFLRSGDRITLSFGGLLFEGRIRGDRVTLERISEHDFDGPWKVTETIDATLGASEDCVVLRGTYRYAECDTSPGASCPGPCSISAPLSVRATG